VRRQRDSKEKEKKRKSVLKHSGGRKSNASALSRKSLISNVRLSTKRSVGYRS